MPEGLAVRNLAERARQERPHQHLDVGRGGFDVDGPRGRAQLEERVHDAAVVTFDEQRGQRSAQHDALQVVEAPHDAEVEHRDVRRRA